MLTLQFEDVDVLFNIVTDDTAFKRNDGDKFWRGPKAKAVSLLQLLISGLSLPRGIIYDHIAGTGMSNLFKITMFLDLANSITCD
jgi:hypothetical protein